MLINNGYELEFKTLMKIVENSDCECNKLIKKQSHRFGIIEDSVYQIDTIRFMCYKNRIYLQNQENIKQIIFKELHDNPYAGHPG